MFVQTLSQNSKNDFFNVGIGRQLQTCNAMIQSFKLQINLIFSSDIGSHCKLPLFGIWQTENKSRRKGYNG